MTDKEFQMIREVMLSGRAVDIVLDPVLSAVLRNGAGGVIIAMDNGQQISFRVISVTQVGSRTFVT